MADKNDIRQFIRDFYSIGHLNIYLFIVKYLFPISTQRITDKILFVFCSLFETFIQIKVLCPRSPIYLLFRPTREKFADRSEIVLLLYFYSSTNRVHDYDNASLTFKRTSVLRLLCVTGWTFRYIENVRLKMEKTERTDTTMVETTDVHTNVKYIKEYKKTTLRFVSISSVIDTNTRAIFIGKASRAYEL